MFTTVRFLRNTVIINVFLPNVNSYCINRALAVLAANDAVDDVTYSRT